MDFFRNLGKSIKEFHTKKPHIEFFTALLTIPVLLTVLILNWNNLSGQKSQEKPNQIVVNTPTEKVSPTEICNKEIGPVTIASPEEDEEISDNPLIIDIDYAKGDYCAVVWSYRINNGRWSSYDDNSVALYNPPKGEIKFDLRVKSVVTGEEKTLTRNFVYTGNEVVPTPPPVATSSAN